MAVTTTTTSAAIIADRWELKILKARYAKEVMAQRMLNASETILQFGDVYNFTTEDSLVGGTVSTTADFDTETLDPTGNAVTVNTWRYVAFEIDFMTQRQSPVDLKEQYSDSVGNRFAELTDTDLASTASSIAAANVIGNSTNPIAFDEDLAFAAMLVLADLNVPNEDLSFFLPPIAFFEGLYKKDRWTSANMMGLPKSVLTTGFEFPILGVPAYRSTVLATLSDAYRAILAHKEWQALVRQIKVDWKTESGIPAKRATTMHFANTLYGFGQIRGNHAAQIFVRRTRQTI